VEREEVVEVVAEAVREYEVEQSDGKAAGEPVYGACLLEPTVVWWMIGVYAAGVCR
jgi:hypothetical protein